MTNLAKILLPANVVLGLEVSSKKRAFEQAGLIFENNCGIARDQFFSAGETGKPPQFERFAVFIEELLDRERGGGRHDGKLER